MFLTGQDARVAAWVYGQMDGPLDPPTGAVAVGWLDGPNLVGGLVFHTYTPGRNLFVDLALSQSRFPPAFLRFGLRYPFEQLRVPRLTFSIDSANLRSRRLVERLGAVQEATLSCAARHGDLLFYALRPESSSLCRRFLSVQRQHSAPAGLQHADPATAGDES